MVVEVAFRMPRVAILAAVLLAAIPALAGANSPDPHYLAASTCAIAHKSVFIHGYLHGYEEGFYLGDLDLQVGRSARDISKAREGHDVRGYRHEFGDKHLFEDGYRQGVRVGYADAISGRSFRVIGELKAAMALVPDAAPQGPDPVFDQGFSAGYTSGQHQGVQDGRRAAAFAASQPACPAAPGAGHNLPDYCAAYLSGYRFGYSDGFVNVRRSPVVQAEVRGGGK